MLWLQARVALLKETMSPKTVTSVILVNSDDGKEEEKDTTPDVDPREVRRLGGAGRGWEGVEWVGG